MSIIDLAGSNLDDTFEPEVLDKGEEVELRIVSVLQKDNKEGHPYIMPFFEVVGNERAVEFGDYLELPGDHMSEKKKNQAKLRMVSFFTAFDIDYSQSIDLEDIVGNTGWAILGIGKDQDDNDTNKINKYVSDRD